MGRPIIKAVYVQDTNDICPFEYYDNPLFKDIDRAMQSKNEDAQMDFIMDLAILHYGLKDELKEDNPHKETIATYIQNYLMPIDMNKHLDRPLFEKRIQKLEERRMKRIVIPEGEFSFANKGKHSDDWIALKIGEDAKTGSTDLALNCIINGVAMGLDRCVRNAYTKEELRDILLQLGETEIIGNEDVWDTLSKFNTNKLLKNMSAADAKIAEEGLHYVKAINGHTYSDEEKAVQDKLIKQDKASHQLAKIDSATEEAAVCRETTVNSVYQYASDMDLSFITDYNTFKEIKQSRLDFAKYFCGENWAPNRPQDLIMDQLNPDTLAQNLAEFSQKIQSVSGVRRWNSPQFNAIQDDLKILQTDLKKGNRTKNLENIKLSLETLSRHCQDYLDKNAAKGRMPRGKKRKNFVQEIKAAIDAQYKQFQEIENEVTGERGLDKEPHDWVVVDKEVAKDGHIRIKMSYPQLEGKENQNSMPKPSNPSPTALKLSDSHKEMGK